MTCTLCGQPVGMDAGFCGSCGTKVVHHADEPRVAASASPEQIKSIATRVWKVFVATLRDPIDGLPASFQGLSKRESLEAGIGFAVLFDLCALFGIYMMLPRWAGQPGLGDILKILLFGFVSPAALTGAVFLARKAFRASGGSIESDVFIAGISLIPTGILLLLSGVLGIGNFEVTALVAVFALSYTILILLTGCTRISGIAQVLAVPAVPTIIVVAAWLSKVVFAAML